MLAWNESDGLNHSPFAHYQIIRRNGAVIPFEPSRISVVIRALGLVFGVNRKPTSDSVGVMAEKGTLSTRTQTAKQSGFFFASKANLRNAP
jgi:hypothetical protein